MQVACGRCCRQPDQSVKAPQNPPVDQRLRNLHHISPEAISQPLQMFGSTLRPIVSAKLSGPTAKQPSNVSERAAIRDKAFQPLIMYQESSFNSRTAVGSFLQGEALNECRCGALGTYETVISERGRDKKIKSGKTERMKASSPS